MRRIKNKSETHKTKKYHEVPSEKLQEWSDTIVNLNKKCYDYKAENDTLIDDLVWHKAKVSRLERENEQLKESHIKHITNMENYYKDRLQKLKEENGELQEVIEGKNSDLLFTEEAYIKAEAFDEVRKYILNNHNEFEDRKDRAENSREYDYFRALQIANNAVINKCKQLEENNG